MQVYVLFFFTVSAWSVSIWMEGLLAPMNPQTKILEKKKKKNYKNTYEKEILKRLVEYFHCDYFFN